MSMSERDKDMKCCGIAAEGADRVEIHSRCTAKEQRTNNDLIGVEEPERFPECLGLRELSR